MVSVPQMEGTDRTARTPTRRAAAATWGKVSPCSYRSMRKALAVRNEVRHGPSSLSYWTMSSSSATVAVIAAVAGRPRIEMAIVAASQPGTDTVAASAIAASAPPRVRWVCNTSASSCRVLTNSSDIYALLFPRGCRASHLRSGAAPLGTGDDLCGDDTQFAVLLLGLFDQRVERLVGPATDGVHDDPLGQVDHFSTG